MANKWLSPDLIPRPEVGARLQRPASALLVGLAKRWARKMAISATPARLSNANIFTARRVQVLLLRQ